MATAAQAVVNHQAIADPQTEQHVSSFPKSFAIQIVPDEQQLTTDNCSLNSDILIYSEMAEAVLRERHVGAARIWWILRSAESSGQLSKAQVRHHLQHHVGGWRRIRQLLCEGDGLFWVWDGERVWLRSRVKVAAALGIRRFSADPVSIEIDALFGRVAQVKATLYAICHSTRQSTPISRETLQELTGISHSSQRNYEARASIITQPQFALFSASDQAVAWQHGQATFAFVDYCGKHGRAGQRWIARQLPNTYSQPFSQRTHQSQKRKLNRKLADLLKLGTTGNDWQTNERLYDVNGVTGKGYVKGMGNVWYVRSNEEGRDNRLLNLSYPEL